MSRAIALGIGEHHDCGELAIAITVTENQHRKKLSRQFVQVSRQDLASNELLGMLAFDVWDGSCCGPHMNVQHSVQFYLVALVLLSTVCSVLSSVSAVQGAWE